MDVRAAMVAFALQGRGYRVELTGDPECVVERVRTCEGAPAEANTLYVSRGECDPAGERLRAGSALLEITGPAGTRSRSRSGEPDELIGVVEAVYDAVRFLDAWDSSLVGLCLRGATMQEFIQAGREVLACPLAYFDRNLIVLAASDDYWARSRLFEGEDHDTWIEGQMPASRAASLVEDIDYKNAASIQGGFYYKDDRQRVYYGINTFDHGDYLARLVVALPEGARRLSRGQEQLVGCFHARLDELHLRYAGHAGVISAQNDSLHVLVRNLALGRASASLGEAADVLASYGWAEHDGYLIAKLVFFEGVHWDSISLYLCALLERAMSGSCAFTAERQIVWLVNMTRSLRAGEMQETAEKRFFESLVSIVRNYACKAGVSDVRTGFSDMRRCYLEADRALSVGQVKHPHYWYYKFGDYAFDYLLAKCAEDFSAVQVCHPALAALVDYDARHATEYAKTLVCYLRNSQNTTHAADELFIHRTSFMRRMAQMQKLTDLDLGDCDQVLHILLSARLLGM